MEKLLKLSRAFKHQDRLKIMKLLFEQDLTPSQINKKININQSTLSQHLEDLRTANIVKTTKKGRNITYSLRKKLYADTISLYNSI